MELINSSFINNASVPDTNNPTPAATNEPPFSPYVFVLIDKILRMSITGAISGLGIISNIINVIMFYRQGFLSHSCTVSLTGLAVSDFCYCVSVFWGRVCLFIHYYDDPRKHNWSVYSFYSFTSVRPAAMFSDITCWVTAFIAFERLFSVTFPFKVKAIFTPKRSCAVVCGIFIGTFIWYIPNNFRYIPTWIDWYGTDFLYFKVNDLITYDWHRLHINCRAVLRTAVIFIVLLCNFTIFWTVHLSKAFKKSAASTTTSTVSSSTQDPNSSTQEGSKQVKSKKGFADASYNAKKEMKLLRMITVLAAMFSICFIANFVELVIFDISDWGQSRNFHFYTSHTVDMVTTLFLTINSSCNIIIYYIMSTRYREDLQSCLCKRKQ